MKKLLNFSWISIQNFLLVIIFSFAAVIVVYGSYLRVFEVNELNMLDLRFRLRPPIKTTEKVVIVEIADDSIKKLGRFPFDRRYHSLLIKVLSEYGAKAVLFDIFFSESDQNDAEMEKAIKEAGNVYLPYVFDLDSSKGQNILIAKGFNAQNLAFFNTVSKGAGPINIIPDPDGKYRKVPLLIKYNEEIVPYVSLRLVSDYLGIDQKDIIYRPGKYIRLGRYVKIPLDKESNSIVNYAGEWGKFYKHYSFVDILRSYASIRSGEKPFLDPNFFKDKICIIGLTATGTTDLHPTPFSSLYPALAIHADLINSIINRRFITRAPKEFNLFLLIVFASFISWGIFAGKPNKAFGILILTVTLYFFTAFLLFILFGVWIDMFYPLIALPFLYLIGALMISVIEWRKKILFENELLIAKKIQESFLPKILPRTNNMDIAAKILTARQVGGDLYDFYEFTPTTLGVMIGDVSGKGIPASLFMTTVSGSFKFFALPDAPPQQVLYSLNEKLRKESSSNLFVTIFYAIFDTEKKIMNYANGGHLPVLHLSRSAQGQLLDVEDGYPLGMTESAYSGNSVKFSKGDIFIFYTDGITEARDSRSKLYGKERLFSVIDKNRNKTAQEISLAIEKDIRKFEPQHKQSDDITYIVIKIS
ncbi:MAG: CHASE2 domain-containing protein [Candidatus Omnitrophica bacterium]|nr:CHASE2 domain-containing protein [Candidatus Omnitrophota bacterium]